MSKVRIEKRKTGKVRYTYDAKDRVIAIESLPLKGKGKRCPKLTLDPDRQYGVFRSQNMFDEFARGNATACTAFGDDAVVGQVAYESWCQYYFDLFAKVPE